MALGLSIPQDVSIVGFDDFRTVSTGLKPQLTTAALPYYDLGLQGAEWLNRVTAGDRVRPSSRVAACKLIERASVCAGPAGAT
jgi:LacI family transcriptional regulator